jgi:hypothetical protein
MPPHLRESGRGLHAAAAADPLAAEALQAPPGRSIFLIELTSYTSS